LRGYEIDDHTGGCDERLIERQWVIAEWKSRRMDDGLSY
jgi:hypothetical protein